VFFMDILKGMRFMIVASGIEMTYFVTWRVQKVVSFILGQSFHIELNHLFSVC
jgi:hypothetical protein